MFIHEKHQRSDEERGHSWEGTWNIFNIEIFQMQARAMIEAGVVGLLPLVPFMQGADLATIEAAAQVMQATAPEELQTTFTTLLAVFTAQFHGKSAAQAIIGRLKMSTDIFQDSPLYQEWVQTAEAKGEAKGQLLGLRHAM